MAAIYAIARSMSCIRFVHLRFSTSCALAGPSWGRSFVRFISLRRCCSPPPPSLSREARRRLVSPCRPLHRQRPPTATGRGRKSTSTAILLRRMPRRRLSPPRSSRPRSQFNPRLSLSGQQRSARLWNDLRGRSLLNAAWLQIWSGSPLPNRSHLHRRSLRRSLLRHGNPQTHFVKHPRRKTKAARSRGFWG